MEGSRTANRAFLATAFLWIGFVCAISFMEAWLKFRAPNVTLPIGLSIGRVVFYGLNKVEWVLALFTMGYFVFRREKASVFLVIPIVLLALQTFFLLPALSGRVDLVLEGKELPASFTHLYYLGAEVVKVVFLFLVGIRARL